MRASTASSVSRDSQSFSRSLVLTCQRLIKPEEVGKSTMPSSRTSIQDHPGNRDVMRSLEGLEGNSIERTLELLDPGLLRHYYHELRVGGSCDHHLEQDFGEFIDRVPLEHGQLNRHVMRRGVKIEGTFRSFVEDELVLDERKLLEHEVL